MTPEKEGLEKILFVCTANICRSPMAAAIFDALAEDKDLPFRARSAGTAAKVGEPMALNAVSALEEVGIYPEAHRARRVDGAMLEESELILAMGPRHVARLWKINNNATHKIHTLPEYATGASSGETVSDPYGHTMSAYRSSVRQLLEYVEQLVDRLKE